MRAFIATWATAAATCALGLTGPTAALAASPAADREAIARIEQRRIDALVAGDIKTLDELMADDIVIVLQNGVRSTKAQFLADQARRDVVFDVFKLEDNDIRVSGDMAMAAGTYASHAAGQPPGLRRARHLRVYARRGGAWRLIAQQATTIAQPAP